MTYIAALEIKSINIAVHLSQTAKIRLLKANKISTTVSAQHSDYINFFLLEFVMELLEQTGINNHAI